VKSKKALARRAQEEAEAQAKLDKFQTCKAEIRELLGMTIDDTPHGRIFHTAAEWANQHLAMGGILDLSHLERMRDLRTSNTIHAEIEMRYVGGTLSQAMEPRRPQARTPVSFAQQIAQAFATRPTAGMMAALFDPRLSTGTSQRVDSPAPPTTWPPSRADWNDLLTPGCMEEPPNGAIVERWGQWFRVDRYQDQITYTHVDPPEEEP